MRTIGLSLPFLVAAMGGAPSVAAQDKPVEVSFGYSFVRYLEDDAGSAPVGAYLAIAGTKRIAPELDLGWQRDSDEFLGETIVLNTFTATVGPRFRGGSGSARPYFHILGGLRYDTVEGESNTAWGGQTGGGVDLRLGDSVALRLVADFQIFFDEGDNLKTLRLLVGLTF